MWGKMHACLCCNSEMHCSSKIPTVKQSILLDEMHGIVGGEPGAMIDGSYVYTYH